MVINFFLTDSLIFICYLTGPIYICLSLHRGWKGEASFLQFSKKKHVLINCKLAIVTHVKVSEFSLHSPSLISMCLLLYLGTRRIFTYNPLSNTCAGLWRCSALVEQVGLFKPISNMGGEAGESLQKEYSSIKYWLLEGMWFFKYW